MKTLFPSNFSWAFYAFALIFVRIIFLDLSWYSFFAVSISLYQFMLLFNAVGHIIPTRYLLGTMMCVQFFIGPTLAYNGMDEYQYMMYRMRIPEAEYFAYALPAILLFIIGLHVNSGNNRGEIVNRQGIALLVKNKPSLSYWLIGIGFFSELFTGFVPGEFKFVAYLLAAFKFIGLYLILLGEKSVRPIVLFLVIGSVILTSLQKAMFHDLLTWVIYTSAILGIKYKFNLSVKLIGLSCFIVIVVIIQLIKGDLRNELGNESSKENSANTFGKVFKQKEEKGDFIKFENLAESVVRINQGFIVTNIMARVPEMVDFANGEEMYLILEAAFVPRILAPNKLTAGNRDLFVKYSGIPIKEGTSMGLSSLGDAYINFGIVGGSIFMLVLGLFYSEVLNFIQKKSSIYPILILFVCMLFYYPIRPDCEFQTILGHLIKGLILVFAIINMWSSTFKISRAALKIQH